MQGRGDGRRPGAAVTIVVDGRAVRAQAGQSLAAALLAAGIVALRESPRAGDPRGAFCFMGVCQECVVRVDGRAAQACLVRVSDGLAVSLGARIGA
jgi:predicted molibdopterin-dependent oxidoreductase YjgC